MMTAVLLLLLSSISMAVPTLKDQDGDAVTEVIGRPWYDSCSGVTKGGTEVDDIKWINRGDLGDAVIDNHFAVGGDFADWSYSWSTSSLTGILSIDNYAAFDIDSGSNCYHGARLAARYNKGTGDPSNLRWLQVFYYNADPAAPGWPLNTWTVDPISTGPGYDDQPFYFTGTDDPKSYYRGAMELEKNDPILGADLYFGDSPYDGFIENSTHNASMDFCLFLCDANIANKSIVIYDGISWGYEGGCVIPEPASMTLALIGLGSVVLGKRKMQQS